MIGPTVVQTSASLPVSYALPVFRAVVIPERLKNLRRVRRDIPGHDLRESDCRDCRAPKKPCFGTSA